MRAQIASIGDTEAQAAARGRPVKIGRFPLSGNGKALAIGDAEGFVKTIFDAATGELLGAHTIGPDVTELIQGYAVAKTLESTEAELLHTVFPHPTLSVPCTNPCLPPTAGPCTSEPRRTLTPARRTQLVWRPHRSSPSGRGGPMLPTSSVALCNAHAVCP
jgi:hypothetical protein